MPVVIVAVGSRGDVQPYLALAVGLRTRGHDVRVATHSPFREWIESSGLGFAPVEGNPREMLQTEAGKAWLEAGRNPVAFMRGLFEMGEILGERMQEDCWNACQGADLIVWAPLAMVGATAGEALGVPAIPAFLQPYARTREFPSPMVDLGSLPGFANRLSHIAFEQALWLMSRSRANAFRRRVGLPPYGRGGPFGQVRAHGVLFAFSPHAVPRPADWPPGFEVTGYWFLDRPAGWDPPADLTAFLAAGPSPVYVGFGSMMPRDPGAVADLVIGALRDSRARGVLLSGWAGLSRRDSSDDVLVVDDVPHDWLFPRMAAVVHHGGAGTTAAGLRAGVPSLVLPFFADQPFWGRRIADLGVGPAPIGQRALTRERLATALRQALADEGMRKRAARLGEAIRAEDGVGRAVSLIGGARV